MINVIYTGDLLADQCVAYQWLDYNGAEVFDALLTSLDDLPENAQVLGAWDSGTGEQVATPVSDLAQISGGVWEERHIWSGQAPRIV